MQHPIAYIQNMNLDYLVHRLVEKENWQCEDAEDAVRRYRNFLILAYKYPGKGFPPPLDVDEVWHAHILHTKNYMQDCEYIFGGYFHHKPSSGDAEEQLRMQEAAIQAARLYMEEFQESYHGGLEVSSFW